MLPTEWRESVLERRTAIPAVILLSSTFKPVCYNDEAVQVLTYPQDPKKINSLHTHLEKKVRSLVSTSGRTSYSNSFGRMYESGRRQYATRVFTLNVGSNNSSSNGTEPALLLLLERREGKLVDLEKVVEQYRLTPRESQTLRFLLEGLTSKEIARRMDISPHTVKAFLRLVMSKMQVTTRSGIIGKIVTTYN